MPLVYISRSVMILEPMAERTERVKEGEEKAKIKAGLKARIGGAVEKRKREDEDEEDEQERAGAEEAQDEPAKKKRKAKGPKGPNPLSMKKSKKEDSGKNKHAEAEKAVIRKVTKKDPQAAEKATPAADGVEANGVTDGTRKRKRKRKPKDTADGGDAAPVQADED